jgi:hypothetical protein
MSTLNLVGGRRELDLYELAMLSGGPDLAIATAAAQLHGDGLLKSWADGTLQAVGELAGGAHPLECEVHATVRRERAMTGAALRAELGGRNAIALLTEDLTEAGLLETARRGPFGRPRLRPTRAGRRLVDDLRAAAPQLRSHPASGESARATALFGGGSLWLAEPQLASAVGVPREAKRHRDSTLGGGWGYWDGGAGVSGGWFGGDGGGHGGSCGGGGGCGGGGCGGGGG